jgi:cytochrome c oxidase subunit 6a
MVQRRSAQTVPRFATEEEMKKEANNQLKARLARQKEIESGNHVSHAEEVAEMNKWIKISIMVAFPVCILSVAKDLLLVEHAHRKHGPEPDYMKIRNKAFPWECEDCELFNNECWKKCRGESTGDEH